MDIIITISEDETRLLEGWLGVGKIQDWLQNAINNKIRQRADATILEQTDKNPNKFTIAEKLDIIKTLDVIKPVEEI